MHGVRVVVTGGAGFIGSHLCNALLEAGARVTVLDDFSSGSEANLAGLSDRFGGALRVVAGDVLDQRLLLQAMQGTELVFHLAAVTSVEESMHRPERVHQVNCTGTLAVLEACRKSGVQKMIFSSSTSVYGEQSTQPQHEGLIPRPASPYAASKLAGEHYCGVYARTFGVAALSLRYFNVYGPRQRADSDYAAVIPRFIQAWRSGVPPTVYGDGLQTRDFVFVEDVARANLQAARSRCQEGCFNVATGTSQSILGLIETLARVVNTRIEPRFGPVRQGEVRESRGATEKAFEHFQFKAEYSMEAGLRKTLEWFSDRGAEE